MSVISRKFSAAPVRTAAAVWTAIIDMLAKQSTSIRSELMKIEGVVCSIISEGTLQKNPITIVGSSGPRLRIYCLYDEDGSTDDASESDINWNPFEGGWKIYIPVETVDLDWVRNSLALKGSQFQAYEAGTSIQETEEIKNNSNQRSGLTINLSKL